VHTWQTGVKDLVCPENMHLCKQQRRLRRRVEPRVDNSRFSVIDNPAQQLPFITRVKLVPANHSVLSLHRDHLDVHQRYLTCNTPISTGYCSCLCFHPHLLGVVTGRSYSPQQTLQSVPCLCQQSNTIYVEQQFLTPN